MVCITGNLDFSGRRSLALAVLEPVDVGREGVDALDVDLPSAQLSQRLTAPLLCRLLWS